MVNLFWLGSGSLFSPGISGMNAAISACKKGSNWLLATNFLRSAMQFSKTRNAVPHARISMGEEFMIEYNYLYMCKCPSLCFWKFWLAQLEFHARMKISVPPQSTPANANALILALRHCLEDAWKELWWWRRELWNGNQRVREVWHVGIGFGFGSGDAGSLPIDVIVCLFMFMPQALCGLYTHHCTSPVTPIGSHVCLWGRPHLIGLGECLGWLKSGLEQQSPGDMDSRLQCHHECLRKRPGMAICTRQGLVSDPMIAHMALRLVKIEQIWYVERISGGSISFFEDVGASTEWVLEWSETRCKNRATGLIRQLKDFVCAGLLFQMPSLRLLPDVVSFNAAIVACEQGNKWELAPSLLLLGRLAWLGVGRW